MKFKAINLLTIILVVLISTFSISGCFTPQETSDNKTSDEQTDYFKPSISDEKSEVIFTFVDESLYGEYVEEDLPKVIERVSESVVQIVVETSGTSAFYSGVVIGNSSDGKYSYIVTCHHSIVGATKVRVIACDGDESKTFSASPVGTDPQTNLCVIQVSGTLTPAVFYGSASTSVSVGESVITVANALATEEVIASLGIVSSSNYIVSAGEGKENKYVLTDAYANSYSAGGGAFLTKGGFLLGIIDPSSNKIWQGSIIPSEVVQSVCTEIIEKKVVEGRYKLGVTVSDSLTAWGVLESIIVSAISTDGSLYANGAGLRVGDVIRSVSYSKTGDFYPASANDFYDYLYNECNFEIGDKITFFIERNNTNDTVTVTISQYDYFDYVG